MEYLNLVFYLLFAGFSIFEYHKGKVVDAIYFLILALAVGGL